MYADSTKGVSVSIFKRLGGQRYVPGFAGIDGEDDLLRQVVDQRLRSLQVAVCAGFGEPWAG
jgi:hypothetical protein